MFWWIFGIFSRISLGQHRRTPSYQLQIFWTRCSATHHWDPVLSSRREGWRATFCKRILHPPKCQPPHWYWNLFRLRLPHPRVTNEVLAASHMSSEHIPQRGRVQWWCWYNVHRGDAEGLILLLAAWWEFTRVVGFLGSTSVRCPCKSLSLKCATWKGSRASLQFKKTSILINFLFFDWSVHMSS